MEEIQTTTASGTRFFLAPAVQLPRLALSMLVISVLLVLTWMEQGVSVPWHLAAMIVGLGMFPLVAFFALGVPTQKRMIEVLDDRLHLPVTGRSEQMLVVRYREIETLYLRRGARGFFMLETAFAKLQIPLKTFENVDDPARLYGAIRARIDGLVVGAAAKLEKFDEANTTADAAYSRRPVVTIAVMAVLVVTYLVEHALGAVAREYALVPLGAGARILIKDGEVFRLVTSGLLHVSVLHLGINLALLWAFGRWVERLFGARHVALVIGVSLLVGNAAATFSFGFPIFCGAQPAVVGLMGAVAFTGSKHGPSLPHGFRPRFVWWLLAATGLFFLHVFVSEVDVSAELGGALCGVLLAALVLIGPVRKLPRVDVKTATTAVVGLLGVALIGGVIGAVVHAPHGGVDETRLIRHHLDNSWSNEYGLNALAWRISLDPDAPTERLELAKLAIERALERARDDETRGAFEDTRAMILYRLGDTAAAVQQEAEALERTDSSIYATQLARLGRRHTQIVALDGRSHAPVEATLIEHEHRGWGLQLGASTTTTAVTWYAAVEAGGEVRGLLRFEDDPSIDRSVPVWLSAKNAPATWPSGVTLHLIASRTKGATWRAWSRDSEAPELPARP